MLCILFLFIYMLTESRFFDFFFIVTPVPATFDIADNSDDP